MWSRVLRRLLLTSAIVALFLCVAPKLAHAQATLTVYQEASLPRLNADGTQHAKRPLNLTPEGVNYQDCIDNVRIVVPLQMANFVANGYVEVWAGLSGEACTSNVSRTSQTRVCWKINTPTGLTINQNIEIPVRALMSGIRSATSLDDSAGICGQVDLTAVSLNILYFAPGQTNEAASHKSLTVQVDTIGPAAPTGLRALPGNTRLTMNWDSISGEGGVSLLTGIRVYCDLNHSSGIPNVPQCQRLIAERAAAPLTPTDAGTEDAGEETDADADAGSSASILADGGCVNELASDGTVIFDCADANSYPGGGQYVDGSSIGSGGTCESGNLKPPTGTFAPTAAFNECYSCGSITGNTGTSVVAAEVRGEPLQNNLSYAIAVAATDAFDNVGPLSDPLCEYPELTNDFWQAYKNAGGDAGGGCNTTTSQSPVGTVTLLGISLAVVIKKLRRKKDNEK